MKTLKTRSFLALIGVALGIMFTSCKKKETIEACFSASDNEVRVGEVVQFTNCSEDYYVSEWDFGDGNESEVSNTSHQYTEPGDYNVVLRVRDLDGATSETSTQISVSELRISTIKVSHPHIGNSQYRWDFQLDGNYVYDYDPNIDVDSSKFGEYTFTYKNPNLIEEGEISFLVDEFDQTIWSWSPIYRTIFNFNPYKDLPEGSSTLSFSDDSFEVKFTFEETK